jgi:DNA-binding SARP family transcriptional activator
MLQTDEHSLTGQDADGSTTTRRVVHQAERATIPRRIQLLGNFSLFVDDQPVAAFSKPRLQSLLAYLLLHRATPQPRLHLAFLFWPDTSEKQAQTNLRNLLYLLRKSLPEAERCLDFSINTVQWRADAPYWCDVVEFEQAIAQAVRSDNPQARCKALHHAAEFYGGDLLPMLYDDWIAPQRLRLQQEFIATLEQLIVSLIDGQEYNRALAYGQRLLQATPLREESYRTLIRLHELNQDRASALYVYHTCVRVLERELEIEPSPITQALYTQLLQPPEQGSYTMPMAVAATVAVQPAFIGRRREQRYLQTAWMRAAQGQAHLVLIRGEAGIGKTRLAEELLMQVAREGNATARARAYATSGTLAYAPLVEWLQTPILRAGLRQLAPVWQSELTRLLPELLVEEPTLPRPEPLPAGRQRQRLFEAITYALLSVGKPLLLFFDDLQWSEQETLDYLHYLLMRHAQAQLFIVASVQSEALDEDRPVYRWQAGLARHGRLSEIELDLLNRDETTELAAAVAVHALDGEMLQQLYVETAGLPLFVIEAVRARLLAEPGETQESADIRVEDATLPAAVRAVIQTRLAQLTQETRELLGMAAVIGREFTFDVLVRASRLDESSLIRRLDELWRRRMIREQGAAAYDFVHGKLREVAYAALGLLQRKQMHRQVAEALEQIHGADHAPISGQLAFHYEHGGVPTQAVRYYQIAGEIARQLHTNGEALRHYRNAIRLWPSAYPNMASKAELARLYEQMGDIMAIIGEIAATRAAYQQALDLLPSSDVVWRAELLPKLGHVWEREYQYDQALAYYTQAESLLQEQPQRNEQWWQTWLQIQLERMWACYWLNRYEQAEQLAQQLAPVVENTGTPGQRISFFMALGTTLLRRHRFAIATEPVTSCRRALAVSLAWGEPGYIAWSRFGLGFCLLWQGGLDEAEEQMCAALESARQRGDVVHQARCLTYLTVLQRKRGEVTETENHAQRSLAAAKSAHTTEYIGTAHANLAWVSWQRGDSEAVRSHARQALALWDALPKGHSSCAFQWTALTPLMALDLAQDELAGAVTCAHRMLEPSQQALPALLTTRLVQAVTAWDEANPQAARTHLAVALDLARRFAYL